MHRLIRQSDIARGLLAAAMLLALLMRVVVPSGFMTANVDGRLVVQLCTGNGPATVTLDFGKGGSKDTPDKHKAADAPCAFSGGFAGGLIAPALPAILPPALALLQLVNGAAIADLTVHRLAAPPPPAIGPPASI